MSVGAPQQAMRYGTEREHHSSAPGQFGRGMKAASQSPCREFVMASSANAQASVRAFAWAMERVEQTNKRQTIRLAAQDMGGALCGPARCATGTVVLWKKLPGVLGHKKPDGARAERNPPSLCRSLENHPAAVFHRFISGEERGKRLSFFLNGNKIEPCGPFAHRERGAKRPPPFMLKFNDGKAGGQARMGVFIFPPKAPFKSPRACAGTARWNPPRLPDHPAGRAEWNLAPPARHAAPRRVN